MYQAHAWPTARFFAAEAGGCPLDVIAVRIGPRQATIQLDGELDLSNAERVGDALEQELALGLRYARLDLSRLTFLDCSGLRVLVHAHNQFLAACGSLVLTGITSPVARLLAVTHLDEALFIADEPREPRPSRHLSSVPRPIA